MAAYPSQLPQHSALFPRTDVPRGEYVGALFAASSAKIGSETAKIWDARSGVMASELLRSIEMAKIVE